MNRFLPKGRAIARTRAIKRPFRPAVSHRSMGDSTHTPLATTSRMFWDRISQVDRNVLGFGKELGGLRKRVETGFLKMDAEVSTLKTKISVLFLLLGAGCTGIAASIVFLAQAGAYLIGRMIELYGPEIRKALAAIAEGRDSAEKK
ncbi:hypothetical protein C7212DRAFT_364824 [Tuber magnatum]|uniref:Uncharacterized protein n=1 Tax=Tuber magnatum TaxID=42249 RepID=A0A317SPL7_9PEZI|nr:hypothetical protein C7212DRAFT_364824 [Tuber magnatum]